MSGLGKFTWTQRIKCARRRCVTPVQSVLPECLLWFKCPSALFARLPSSQLLPSSAFASDLVSSVGSASEALWRPECSSSGRGSARVHRSHWAKPPLFAGQKGHICQKGTWGNSDKSTEALTRIHFLGAQCGQQDLSLGQAWLEEQGHRSKEGWSSEGKAPWAQASTSRQPDISEGAWLKGKAGSH